MKYKIYTINIFDSNMDDLNKFISTHRIIDIKKSLVSLEDKSYWNFLIEYESSTNEKSENNKKSPNKSTRIDYREILSDDDFTKFSKLRDLRKEIADKNKIAVYNVFDNAQLAEMVTEKIKTKEGLSKISGIGDSKLDKFATVFLELLVQF